MDKGFNFSIGPGLIAHWLSYFKVFTSIIFYHVGQMPSDVKWRKREKRNDKEHHEKASFSYSRVFERGFFCFIFEKTSCEEKVQVNFLSEAAVRRCTSK